MKLTNDLEQCRQNHLYLVERYLDNGCDSLPEAMVKAGVAKAFYIRREVITAKHHLRRMSASIQMQIVRAKAEGRDTSKLKGRLWGIDYARGYLAEVLHTPRKDALTPTDRLWVNHYEPVP